MTVFIDAKGLYFRDLNERLKEILKSDVKKIIIDNVNGQRYIGTGVSGDQTLVINGIPGNDLAAYMDGLKLIINGNVQEAVGNTMNNGKIVIHGHGGDTLGYAMRGGEIYVRDNVGFRVGIHMKGYQEKIPVIVVGGKAGDFLGEYMAGGIQIILGLNLKPSERIVGDFCGTGMHGGVIFLRGKVEEYQVGKEVKIMNTTDEDLKIISKYVENYAYYFKKDFNKIMSKPFFKLIPYNANPYGDLYVKY